MDPTLIAAAHALLSQPDTTDAEQFIRQQTNNKYGADDADKYLSSINTSVTPANVGRSVAMGATANFAPDAMDVDPQTLAGVDLGPAAGGPAGSALAAGILKLLGAHPGEGAEMRTKNELFQKAHPVVAAAGNIAGAVGSTALLPELKIAEGAGALTRGALALAKGAGTGYAMGTASDAGAQDPSTRDWGAAATSLPAFLGAGAGIVAPALTGAYRYITKPGAQAANRIGTALSQSGGIDAINKTLDDYDAAGLGDQVTLGGTSFPLSAARKFAVKNSISAENTTLPQLNDIQAGQVPRLTAKAQDLLPDMGGMFNGGDRLAQLKAATRNWAEGPEGYGGIGSDTVVPNTEVIATKAIPARPAMPMSAAGQEFQNMMDNIFKIEPKGQQAFAQKVVDAPDDANMFGAHTPMIRRLATEYMMGETPAYAGRAASPPTPAILASPIVSGALQKAQDAGLIRNIPTADATYGKLQSTMIRVRSLAQKAFASGDGDLGSSLQHAGQVIDDHLATNMPDHMAVTQEYAQRMGDQRFLQKGMDAWNSGDVGQLLRTTQGATPSQLLEFRRGLASSMFDKLNNTAESTNAANGLLDASQEAGGEGGVASRVTGATKAKLKILFGDADPSAPGSNYSNFMKQAKLESDMSTARARLGGSDTYQNALAGNAEPLNMALTSMSAGMNGGVGLALPKSVLMRMGARGARAQLNNAAATDMGSALGTQGSQNIRNYLARFALEHGGNSAPLVGRGALHMVPAGTAAGTEGLLGPHQTP